MQEIFDNYKQESLRFALEQAIRKDDSIQKNECYKNICSYIIATNKHSYSDWNQFREKCVREIDEYVNVSAFFNMNSDLYLPSDQANANYQYRNTINNFRKTLNEQLIEVKKAHFKKQQPKNSCLCSRLFLAGCALTSGFIYGVTYGYGSC